MEFFDLVYEIIDEPITKDEYENILGLIEKNKNNNNEKNIDYTNNNVTELNKKGYYILVNLINHKKFYESIPDTKLAKKLKTDGYVIIENIKLNNDGKISNIDNICKELFNRSKPKRKLEKCILKGPYKDKQNQLHMDRAYPTIKWFLYMNDVKKKMVRLHMFQNHIYLQKKN